MERILGPFLAGRGIVEGYGCVLENEDSSGLQRVVPEGEVVRD